MKVKEDGMGYTPAWATGTAEGIFGAGGAGSKKEEVVQKGSLKKRNRKKVRLANVAGGSKSVAAISLMTGWSQQVGVGTPTVPKNADSAEGFGEK